VKGYIERGESRGRLRAPQASRNNALLNALAFAHESLNTGHPVSLPGAQPVQTRQPLTSFDLILRY